MAPTGSHPTKNIERLLAESPPRRLRCFDSDETWLDYLRSVHYSGDSLTRRQDTGKHRGERKVVAVLVDGASTKACDDCQAGFQRAMKAAGRCEMVSPGSAARRWLMALLARGPMLAHEVYLVAREQGLAARTVRRAAQRLRLLRRRRGPGIETTVWALPEAS
jgi:hypothetical protein